MSDRREAFPPEEYDARIGAIVPYYACFHREIIDLVGTLRPLPARWLDTGCGTGSLVAAALGVFPTTRFMLADPSGPMLSRAAARLAGASGRVGFVEGPSQDLALAADSFDVVTAVLAHHYLGRPARVAATANCRRMLKDGGVYVTFENIRPFSAAGMRAGMDRWRAFQLRESRDPAEVESHLARFDREYFPMTIADHLDLLREAGFGAAEIFWASQMQAGFWAVREG